MARTEGYVSQGYSMPQDMVDDIATIARGVGENKSYVVREAVRLFLAQPKNRRLLRQAQQKVS